MSTGSTGPDADLLRLRFLVDAAVTALLAIGLVVTLVVGSPTWVPIFLGLMALGGAYATVRARAIWRARR